MSAPAHIASWYAQTLNDPSHRPRLDEAIEADVCVIGAGYTGLHTAIELADRGYSVVVLEAQRVGWGASGRNGGQVCTAYASGMDKIAGWLGQADAKRLFDLAEESKDILRERIERFGIDCSINWGYLLAANRPRELRECEEWAESAARDYGYEKLEVVRDTAALRRLVNSPRYTSGLIDHGAGHLHPLNYCAGLARGAESLGVRIFEDSAAVAVERGEPIVVRTAAGQVRASFAVSAGNAYLDDLLPELRSTIMPVGTYIGATTPLGEERARALLPQNHAVADLKFVLDYFRRSDDHRLLFGGRVSYSKLEPANLRSSMRRAMLKVFPQLSEVQIDSAWGGFVGITRERTPDLGRLTPSLYYAQGFSGQGVALTGIAGRVLAEAIAGQAERYDLFACLPHSSFPGGPLLRTPSLVLAMLWFRLQDLLP
ncbi:NAD(P)/FAD-dependent oxidoreductase [Aquibaculum sediminis]|uniref:NAD(P)/FAD-dependent oxidoreductase n=1 Tax=Aquibaculum sediminis TaxID=3231907 RepID=UPI003453A6A6